MRDSSVLLSSGPNVQTLKSYSGGSLLLPAPWEQDYLLAAPFI